MRVVSDTRFLEVLDLFGFLNHLLCYFFISLDDRESVGENSDEGSPLV